MTAPSLVKIDSHSPEDTRRLGTQLARHLRGGDIVLLSGDLGAGKTTLTQGIAAGLGVSQPVTSPTFALINEYQGATAGGETVLLYHVDLYRVGPDDADTLGLADYLAAPDAIGIIEWPDAAPHLLPDEALAVQITAGPGTHRRLELRPYGTTPQRYIDLLAAFAEEMHRAGQA